MRKRQLLFCIFLTLCICQHTKGQQDQLPKVKYSGSYFSGTGDTAYLRLLNEAYRMLMPDPALENLSLLYKPEWNGFSEGPTWKYWWIQNSFGPTYTMLPYMDKAYQTFIFNSQALWFNVIGNGVRKDNNNFAGPKGVLVDCARNSPTDYYCKQGDYKVNIHDWPIGFTTAGILLQSELMLERRDTAEIGHYLPLLELSAEFVDSRRDTVKNIFLVGTAGNLLAPSYAGSGERTDDGTYKMAYLSEISVNYIAALNRLIELEKMTHRKDKIILYGKRLEKVKKGLSYFVTPEGYFIRSLDVDGTKHGEYGSSRHGYFETAPNQDAMAFRVVNDGQANRIYRKIQSIPELRMHKLILPNYPSYDDMYDTTNLFRFGDWVNGGHWTTCEARMQMGYYRVNAFNDAKEAFKVILDRAYRFRLDNPLKDFGAKEYQPDIPVNCVYDSWGAPGGFLRGLFEYEYKSDGLVLYPHIPDGVDELHQHFPVYFGKQRIYISAHGHGKITSVAINNKPAKNFTTECITLKADNIKNDIYVSIGLGDAPSLRHDPSEIKAWHFKAPADESFWDISTLHETSDTVKTSKTEIDTLKRVMKFFVLLQSPELRETYEAKHAELILKCLDAIYSRRQMKNDGKLVSLSQNTQVAADQLFIDAVANLKDGLVRHLEKCRLSDDQQKRKFADLWEKTQ